MIRSSNHLCSFERIWSWIRSNSLCSMNATNAWTKLTCERSSRWAGMLKLGVVSGRSTRNIFLWEKIYVEKVERFWWIWKGDKRKHVNLCAFDSNGSCVLMTFFSWLIEWHAKVGKDLKLVENHYLQMCYAFQNAMIWMLNSWVSFVGSLVKYLQTCMPKDERFGWGPIRDVLRPQDVQQIFLETPKKKQVQMSWLKSAAVEVITLGHPET